jgi:hypothetical protein
MKTLDEIGIAHQTDKASQFSRTYAQPHNYLVHLERFFEPMRDKEIELLEIGCGGGESVRTWLEYFTKAHVYSVDIVHSTNPWNTPNSNVHERYTFIQGNQADPGFWQELTKAHHLEFDIIIDDGSHISSDIMTTFNSLWAHLKRGGFYEIEDLNAANEAKIWLERLSGAIHGPVTALDFIYFSRELCVMRKK